MLIDGQYWGRFVAQDNKYVRAERAPPMPCNWDGYKIVFVGSSAGEWVYWIWGQCKGDVDNGDGSEFEETMDEATKEGDYRDGPGNLDFAD